MKANGWRWLNIVICSLVSFFMIAPLLVVTAISFSSAPFLTFPPPGLSTRWYVALRDPAWTESLITSVIVMFPTALLSTGLALGAALALNRSTHILASAARAVLMAPLVVPAIITGAALYGLFRGWGINGTRGGLILAHVLLAIPYSLSTITTSLGVTDSRLEQAAANLGASPWVVFTSVTFPLIRPGVLSSLLFALVVSFDELIVSLFISSPYARPVTVQMWSNIRGDVDPTIAALATVLFLFALAVLMIESLVGRGLASR